VGSYPTVSPLPADSPVAIRVGELQSDPLKVFLPLVTEAKLAVGLLSVALSVAKSQLSSDEPTRQISLVNSSSSSDKGNTMFLHFDDICDPASGYAQHILGSFRPSHRLAPNGGWWPLASIGWGFG
jgi:hypothetical protein